MARTASNWLPNVAAPDLSNVLRMAGRAGRDEGYNQFMEQLIQYKRSQLEENARKRAEKRKAEEDLANNPESDGFWQKVGDFAADGFERTIDVLSRFGYASANTAKYLVGQDEDDPSRNRSWLENLGNFVTPTLTAFTGRGLGDFADDLSFKDIAGAGNAWWQGFSGKEKTMFPQILAENAKKDKRQNIFDNKWYQGIGGFIGDVAMDPTTYIGVGLVTKPLKAAHAAAEAGKASKKLEHFAEDAGKLGLKYTDETGAQITLDKDLIYEALGGADRPGKSRIVTSGPKATGSQKAMQARAFTDNYEIIKKAIADHPNLETNSAVKALDDALENLRRERNAKISQAANDAYREGLTEFAAKNAKDIPGDPSDFAQRLGDTWDEVLNTAKVAEVMKEIARWGGVKGEFPRPNPKVAPRKFAAWQQARAEKLDELLGDAYHTDVRITQEFRNEILAKVDAETAPARGNISKQNAALNKQINEAYDNAADAKAKGDRNTANMWYRKAAELRSKRDNEWARYNQRRANTFLALLKQHTDDVDWASIDSGWKALDDREKEIVATLSRRSVHDRGVGQAYTTDARRLELDEEGQPIQPIEQSKFEAQADATEALQAELREIRRGKQEIEDRRYLRGDDLETPEGFSGSVEEVLRFEKDGEVAPKAGELDPEVERWAEAVAEEVNDNARLYARNAEESWKRAEREKIANKPDEMFGGPRNTSPKIHIDDSDITLTDLRSDAKFNKEAREALEQRATDLDRRVNKARAQGNLYQKADPQVNALRVYARNNSDDLIRRPNESVGDFNKRVDKFAADIFTNEQLEIAQKAIQGNPTARQIEARVTRLLNEKTSKLEQVVKNEHVSGVAEVVRSYRNKVLKGKLSNRQKMDIRHALNKVLSPEGAKTASDAAYIDRVQDAVVGAILAVGKQSKISDNLAREVAEYAKNLADITDAFGKKALSGGVREPLAVTVFRRLFDEQHGMPIEAAQALRKSRANAPKKLPTPSPKPTQAQRAKWTKEGAERAIKALDNDLKRGAKVKTLVDKSVNLRGVRGGGSVSDAVKDVKNAHNAARDKVQERYAAAFAQEKANLKVAKARDEVPDIARIEAKIEDLKKSKSLEIKALESAREDAVMTTKALLQRMDEQVTLDLLNEAMVTGRNYVSFNFAGAHIMDIPDFAHLTELTQAIAGLPIIKKAREVWGQAFHPASTLEPELNLARLRVQSRTPEIVQFHVEHLMNRFSHYAPSDRKAAFRSMLKGAAGDDQLSQELIEEFDNLLPYFRGEVQVGDETLAIREINRFLPEEFQLVHPKGQTDARIIIHNRQQLLEHIRRLKPNADPLQVLWRMRIATEQALADKAMRINVKTLFGVKRIIRTKAEGNLGPPSVQERLIEDLHNLHGWREVRDIGHDYYFAPEMADQIEQLMRMMKPQFIHEITKNFDRVTRTWKGAVTIYNPGYYTRNGIGEFMMGMFDGVNVGAYSKAMQVLKYKMPDSVKKALQDLEPWKAHKSTSNVKIVRLKNGKELTLDDVWVLYHQAGLKTGFISQEFDHFFPSAGSVRASGVGKAAVKANDKVRAAGEKYEDYFRLAHFIDRLKRSGYRDPVAAAEDAARYVRKFHFDYTDFTPFEKTVMMRIFPFYKWTRKALPLMANMLFTRPGLVNLYPKAMSGLSVATGGVDPLKDDNGWLPNYENVTPEWVKHLFSYPIGRDEEGNMTYMNIANPPFDVYKMMQDPIGTSMGMANPLLKMPIEQAQGGTLDPDFKIEFEDDKYGDRTGWDKRKDHLMRFAPQTSWIAQLMKGSAPDKESKWQEPGFGLDERTNSFLIGLGFYENNRDSKMGELLRKQEKGTLTEKDKKAMGRFLHQYKEEAN